MSEITNAHETAGGEVQVSPAAVAQVASAAARRVDGVLDLNSGAVGEIATYGGGERVPGVRVRLESAASRVRIRLVVGYGPRLDDLAETVRQQIVTDVAEQFPDLPPASVDVHIADLRLEELSAGGSGDAAS